MRCVTFRRGPEGNTAAVAIASVVGAARQRGADTGMTLVRKGDNVTISYEAGLSMEFREVPDGEEMTVVLTGDLADAAADAIQSPGPEVNAVLRQELRQLLGIT